MDKMGVNSLASLCVCVCMKGPTKLNRKKRVSTGLNRDASKSILNPSQLPCLVVKIDLHHSIVMFNLNANHFPPSFMHLICGTI